MNETQQEAVEFESTVGLQTAILFLLAFAIGAIAAVILLPIMVPSLTYSLEGTGPKAFWFLSRATSFVALSLLWLSMALGLIMTNKMARVWPGVPASFAIHEYVSLLGIGFAIFHAFILLGDQYIGFTVKQILVPFSTTGYRPFYVGVGQTAIYLWMIVAFSFYIKSRIGQKTWRWLHYLSFGIYLIGLYHGITSGTDTKDAWAQNYYWISGGALLFLLIYRILVSISTTMEKNKKTPLTQQAS
mgnify:CR=1 FL=1